MALPPQAAAQETARVRLQTADLLSPEDHLLALREAKGLSQNKLADLLSTQGPTVQSWEKGTLGPDGVRKRKRPTGPSPHAIEAWSRLVVAELDLPASAVLLATKWLDPQERAAIQALSSGPEASP